MIAAAAQQRSPASSAGLGRVVIATVARPTGDTGVHTHSRALRGGLLNAGFDCELATPFDRGRKWLPIFSARRAVIYPLNRTWATRWYRHWHLAALRENLLESLGARFVDGVVAQCPLSARAALDVRRRLDRRFPIDMVCHFNHSEAREYRDKGELSDPRYYQSVLAFEKDVLESVDQVIYVSAWAQRVVEQERGIKPQASTVIWNGLPGTTPPPKLIREDLGLGSDDLVLINVGTLEPRKNQIALIELFKHVVAEFPRSRLLLVGEGPSRREIEARIAAIGLQSQVQLLGMRNDVPDLLALSDLYVHASLLENCPMALLEAARAGLPVAAAPAGGVPELLEALNGVAIDVDDPAASLATLRPLLRNRPDRARAGQSARILFEQRFTREAMTCQYLRALGLTSSRQ